ncbi:MAG: T9SS type A sorting domain-containing protein [Flavobacteriaceae bacterium]|nr:T9SS type A sorting domain-containing protein [Flavobacteriaceae bacterium]
MPENGRVFRFTPQNLSISETPLNGEIIEILNNPVKNELRYKSKEQVKSVRIFNISGKYVKSIIDPTNSLKMEDIKSGLYLIVFELDSDLKITKRILVD